MATSQKDPAEIPSGISASFFTCLTVLFSDLDLSVHVGQTQLGKKWVCSQLLKLTPIIKLTGAEIYSFFFR